MTGRCLTEHSTSSPEETYALGGRLALRLGTDSVVALKGGLGAGKTTLVKGIARSLGVTETITSPTYTIVSEYQACLNEQAIPLYHIDAYRLSGDDDFENTGAGELIGSIAAKIARGIAIIEWSERIPHFIPPDALFIEIEITGTESRLFRINGEL